MSYISLIISINELFLGAAPGGVNQIVLVALATGADVAMITSYIRQSFSSYLLLHQAVHLLFNIVPEA